MGAKIGKSYKSVDDMLRGVFPEHPEMVESFVKMHGREQIANMLFMLRTHHGVTQEEMGKRLGVSQSAIAKMEDRGDNIKFNAVIEYAHALGFGATLQLVPEGMTASAIIRWHLQAVAVLMDRLAGLADGDKDISEGAFKHFATETRRMLEEVLPKWAPMLSGLDDVPPAKESPELHFDIHAMDMKEFAVARG